MGDFGADKFYTEVDKLRDQLEMGYPNLKWVIPDEWCHDWYGPYPSGDQKDPTGPDQGTCRVARGGCFFSGGDDTNQTRKLRWIRSASRNQFRPDDLYSIISFRIVLAAQINATK